MDRNPTGWRIRDIKKQIEDTSSYIEEGARAVKTEASEKNIIEVKKKVMIHKQQDIILDDLKKCEDAPEYPEFIKTKVIETKADGQKNNKSRTHHTV